MSPQKTSLQCWLPVSCKQGILKYLGLVFYLQRTLRFIAVSANNTSSVLDHMRWVKDASENMINITFQVHSQLPLILLYLLWIPTYIKYMKIFSSIGDSWSIGLQPNWNRIDFHLNWFVT